MTHHKLAIIDLGTNTFHILIAEVRPDRGYRIVLRRRIPVMIGQGGINDGIITEAAQQRALAALRQFAQLLQTHEVTQVRATATSAFRSAQNGPALAELIRAETGITVEIIDGMQEAAYIFRGVQAALLLDNEPVLIMDIGGGSVEFIISSQQRVQWKQSFEVGAQRLLDRFSIQDPMSVENREELQKYFTETLAELVEAGRTWHPLTLIGASGTFETLCNIHAHRHRLTIADEDCELPISAASFSDILQELLVKDRAERLAIPGMIEMRVDMIVVAAWLIEFVLTQLGVKKLRVSAYAMKEGVLQEMVDNFR